MKCPFISASMCVYNEVLPYGILVRRGDETTCGASFTAIDSSIHQKHRSSHRHIHAQPCNAMARSVGAVHQGLEFMAHGE